MSSTPQGFDHNAGLINFFNSQATLLLEQYHNLEQLLGPPGADWTWHGEHCESLLREAIERILPDSLRVGKGYIYGHRKTESGMERSPEIDILIYDSEQYAPLFSMGTFVIVRAECVKAIIQVKRTLTAATLTKAIKNLVTAKQHVYATCLNNAEETTERIFSGVISFEDGLGLTKDCELCKSYETTIKQYISKFEDGKYLPDFVGSLTGVFLDFKGVNTNWMVYQAFSAVHKKMNISLPYFLYSLSLKVSRYGHQILPGFTNDYPMLEAIKIWESSTAPKMGE